MGNNALLQKKIVSRFHLADYFVFLFAFTIRLLHVWLISDNPFFASPIFDAEMYDQDAWRIAQGNWIGNEAFFQAPLYSYFLAVIYAIFGHSCLVPRLVQAALGALTAWLAYRLGLRLYDKRIALLAGMIVTLYGPLIHYCGQLLPASLTVFLVILFLIQFDRLLDQPANWKFLLAGLLLGLSALSQPKILIFLPFSLIWMVFRLKDRGRGLILFFVGVALMILPVTLRNWSVSKDFVLISSQGGVEFYMGNNPVATGYSAWVPGTPADWWLEGYHATIKIAEEVAGMPLKPSEVSAFWWEKAWDEMSTRPIQWGSLTLNKIRYLLAGYEISGSEDVYFQRKFSLILSLLMWYKGLAFPFGVVLPLALFGLALSFSWKRHSHLILFLLSYATTVVFSLVTARSRMPLVPLLSIWAAAGLILPFQLAKSGQLRKYALVGVGFLLLLFLVNRNPLEGWRPSNFDGALNLGNKYLEEKQYEKAIESFREASLADPNSARPVNGMGLALLNLGRTDEAKNAFERAVFLQPSLNQARNNLARILQQEGELSAALNHFAKVLELDSSDVFAQRGYADVLLEMGDYASAQANYEKAYHLGASDAQLISRWAQSLVMQEKFAEALRVNAKLITMQPDNARAHHNQARIYIACDSLHRARRELEIVLRLAPATTEARQQLNEINEKIRPSN